MGLFGINMPMIYGEREKAFIRLQQNIIQKSKDESIFAWTLDNSTTYSGLYALSPSVYIDCSNIVQLPESEGFSENNGELSLQLKLEQSSPSTYRAVLSCAWRANLDLRVFITLARTRNMREYVRVRGPAGFSNGTVLKRGGFKDKERIHVPVNPGEPPEIIFYGFWLRTLQPPGHARCNVSILSRSPISEPNYIGQPTSYHGNSGIVRIDPKDNSNDPKGQKIRWVLFGFSSYDFLPRIWIRKECQYARLIEAFEKAVASPQTSLPSETTDDERALFTAETYRAGYLADVSVDSRDWCSGLIDFLLPKLFLKISIQLLRNDNPALSFSGITTDGSVPSNATMIWVVDIVEVPNRPSKLFGSNLQKLKGKMRPKIKEKEHEEPGLHPFPSTSVTTESNTEGSYTTLPTSYSAVTSSGAMSTASRSSRIEEGT